MSARLDDSTTEAPRRGRWVWPVRLMLVAASLACGALFGVSVHAYWETDGSFALGGFAIVLVASIEGLLFLPRGERFEMVSARTLVVLMPFMVGGAASILWVARDGWELIFPLGFLITAGWWMGVPILLAMLLGRRLRGVSASRIGVDRPA